MKRFAARPLVWLAALLTVYLCAPFIASIQQIGAADWTGVDWRATWSAVGVSVASASVASLVILIGGVPLGYLLARSNSRAMAALGFMVQLPLALPPLTSGVLLLFLLGPYSWIGQFTGGKLTDSFTGIVLAETFVSAPFLIIAAKSAFAAVDPMFEDVAATLGHRARSRFFRVLVPVAWPAISAGLALAWLRAFGEFGATVMVAYHPYSLPVYTYVVFGGQGLPAMMPLLLPTLAIAVVCAALAIYTRRGRAPHPDETLADEPSTATPRPAPSADDRLALRLRKRLGSFTLDFDWSPATRRLAILGPSGSGKSLALRLIAGLEAGETTAVMLGSAALGELPPERRAIGYMPQDYGLFPHMTVARQLAFPVHADAASARYWVDHLGLARLLARLPHELSFGQRQRVALARALAQHSQLLLFDEPFSALDTPRRRLLQQSLRALQREIAVITVLVTHDPDEAAILADEVLVLEEGRALQAGAVDEVYARPASLRVAALLGLHNVGEGRIRSAGVLELADASLLEIADRAIAPGRAVMWRLPASAVAKSEQGGSEGVVEAVELRRGARYVRVKIGGMTLHLPSDDASLQEDTRHRFSLDATRIAVWERQRARP